MNNDRLNPKSQGANSPRNPRQNTLLIPDGSPTKGSVTGHDPAKQTKQQTAQMPMNSTIAAQTALESIDGGGVRTPPACLLWLIFTGVCAFWLFAGAEGRRLATRQFSWNSHGIREFCPGPWEGLNPDQSSPLRKSGDWLRSSGSHPSVTRLPDRRLRSRAK